MCAYGWFSEVVADLDNASDNDHVDDDDEGGHGRRYLEIGKIRVRKERQICASFVATSSCEGDGSGWRKGYIVVEGLMVVEMCGRTFS